MTAQSLVTIAIVLNLFSVATLILYLLSNYWRERESEEKADYFTQLARRRSHALLHNAGKQANKILTDAELKGLEAIAQEKLRGKKLEKKYEEKLSQLQEELSSHLKKSAELADKQYEQFNRELKQAINKTITRQREILELRSETFFTTAHEHIEEFIGRTEEQVSETLTRELTAAKSEIADYRRQKLKIIDESLLSILEKTLAATLNRELDLGDHMELTYKALKKAKAENKLS